MYKTFSLHFAFQRLRRILSYEAISAKLMFRWLQIAFVASLSIWFLSCNIVNPPAFVNKDAHPPAFTQYAIHGVQPGQLISGFVTIKIDSLPPALKLWGVQVFAAGTFQAGQAGSGSTYILTFDSRKIPDGLDTISIHFVLDHDPSIGLLNGAIQFSVNDIYSGRALGYEVNIPVVVKNGIHNAPAPVSNVQCTFNNHPVLSWSQSQDQYFQAYIVRRYWPGTLTDTIFSRSTTSFTDSSLQLYYGTYLSYGVSVWNGYAESTITPISSIYGATILQHGLCKFVCTDPNADVVYLATSPPFENLNASLRSYSTKTNAVIDSLPNLGEAVHFTLSTDGTTICYFDQNTNVLKRLRTSDFTYMSDIPISSSDDFPYALSIGPNRIVSLTNSGMVELIDPSSGNITARRWFINSINFGAAIALSPDGNTLYAGFGSDSIFAIDVSNNTLNVTRKYRFIEQIYGLALIPGTSLIAVEFLTHVKLVNTSDFSLQSDFSISNGTCQDVYSSGGKVFVGWQTFDSGSGGINEYDVSAGSFIKSWSFGMTPTELAVSRDGNFMYVGNYLNTPGGPDYATLIINLK